jgi:YcaO cyclodehydratase, ATP-ad Mg2+-binding
LLYGESNQSSKKRGLKVAAKEQRSEWWESLPFAYSACQMTQGKRPEGYRFFSEIVNIEACLDRKEVRACGEAHDLELATTKAIAELLERSALVKFGARVCQSSNGWAAHTDEESSKRAAVFELIERDAVLANWYTSTPFDVLEAKSLPPAIQAWANDNLPGAEFPILKILLSTKGVGPSATCVLMNKDGFGVASHSTKSTLIEAIENAIGETCRSAHLFLRKDSWSETVALRDGAGKSNANGAHAVYYAYQEPFPKWMFGRPIAQIQAEALWEGRIAEIPWNKFEFHTVMRSPLVVGYATSQDTLPLIWGSKSLEEVLKTPASRRLAANEKEWNHKPHIIS